MAEAAKWYVVHTYSGYENTVKATIEKTIETRQLQDLIHVVSIPMETVTEITDNGPKTYDRKVFPGYVLVKMIMSDEAWYIIKNVRGVTGFVGSGTKPTPLTDEEVQQLGVEKHEIVVAYSEGDTVKIADGPLTSLPALSIWWISKRTRCAWSCPCSDAKRPSNSSSIRSNWSASKPRLEAGTWEGFTPPEIRASVSPHLFRRCLSWHRK